MPRLTLEQRARIILLFEEGYTSRQIATREKVAQSTVIDTRKRMQVTGNLHDKQRSGRPRLLSKRHERRIVRYISSGECSTAVDIQKKLKIDDQIDISAETIRRILKKNGLKSKIKCKKPYLSKKHQKKRLMFAKIHKD